MLNTFVTMGAMSMWGEEVTPLRGSIFILGLVSVFSLTTRPRVMFKDDGSFKHLGVGRDETLLPFWLATSTAGLLSYVLATAARRG